MTVAPLFLAIWVAKCPVPPQHADTNTTSPFCTGHVRVRATMAVSPDIRNAVSSAGGLLASDSAVGRQRRAATRTYSVYPPPKNRTCCPTVKVSTFAPRLTTIPIPSLPKANSGTLSSAFVTLNVSAPPLTPATCTRINTSSSPTIFHSSCMFREVTLAASRNELDFLPTSRWKVLGRNAMVFAKMDSSKDRGGWLVICSMVSVAVLYALSVLKNGDMRSWEEAGIPMAAQCSSMLHEWMVKGLSPRSFVTNCAKSDDSDTGLEPVNS
mmetsp:Transcript_28903/g.33249  ORF Transcript_28903/g.33249 Transcript_28903/m.33249 type:complete len:268 (+) Transcript_28903:987-1790(+)